MKRYRQGRLCSIQDNFYEAGINLVIIAIIQAILCGVSVNVITYDKATLTQSLNQSLSLATSGNPKHLKLWAITSSYFKCCGVYGSDDFRDPNMAPIFPADVPIFCCPTYNSSQPDELQHLAREICKASRSYYTRGCDYYVQTDVEARAVIVIAVTVIFMVFEVILSVYVNIMYRLYKRQESQKDEEAVENRTAEIEASKTGQS